MSHILKPALDSIPAGIISLDDYEKSAREFIRHDILEYINGGVADDRSLHVNRNVFQNYRLYNRVFNSFTETDTTVTLFNKTHPHPIFLAPVAHQGLVHPEAELATAAAASAMQAPMIISSLSNTPVADVSSQASTAWFQLYWQTNRRATSALLNNAIKAGCEAIVITLDAPVSGVRNRAQRAGFSLPAGLTEINLRDLPLPPPRVLNAEDSPVLHGLMQDAPTVEDLRWLRKQTDLPLLAKGISHPSEAQTVTDLGFDGLIISNHGGRTLDNMPSPPELIPAIRRVIGPDIPLLLDSGIRRGTDIITALALGADAVCIGRPQMWGLAVAGALGVAHSVKILKEEMEIAMALTGSPTLTALTPDIFFSENSSEYQTSQSFACGD